MFLWACWGVGVLGDKPRASSILSKHSVLSYIPASGFFLKALIHGILDMAPIFFKTV